MSVREVQDGEYYFDSRILVIKDHRFLGYRETPNGILHIIPEDKTLETTIFSPQKSELSLRIQFWLWRVRFKMNRRFKQWLITQLSNLTKET